jgi:hypothetical protein
MKKIFLIIVIALGLNFASIRPAFAQSLSISCSHSEPGKMAVYRVKFESPKPIQGNVAVALLFPPEFNLSQLKIADISPNPSSMRIQVKQDTVYVFPQGPVAWRTGEQITINMAGIFNPIQFKDFFFALWVENNNEIVFQTQKNVQLNVFGQDENQ